MSSVPLARRLASLRLSSLRGGALSWGLVACWVALGAWRGGGFDPLPVRRVDVYGPRAVQAVDGDTLHFGSREVRLLGVDTPEKAAPWFDGDQEPWASRATALVQRRLAGAERVSVHSFGVRDRYGRELAHVYVDGHLLGEALVAEGLAYPTIRRLGDGGFPAEAARILAAARAPQFEDPWDWRRRHRAEP
jgi:endonuclease YncB( thermonuclease family)